MKWKLISSKPIFESPYLSLFSNSYQLPDNQIKEGYYHLSRPDYVLILAVSDQGRIIVEKQYRRGVDEVVYELPAGWINNDENPIQAAQRELKEETGYEGIGESSMEIYPQPGFSSMKAHIVRLKFSEANTSVAKQLSEDENIEIELKTIDQVKVMVKKGEIKDMGFLSAWSLLSIEN